MSEVLILSLFVVLLCRNRIFSSFAFFSILSLSFSFTLVAQHTKMNGKIDLAEFEPSGKIEITVEGK